MLQCPKCGTTIPRKDVLSEAGRVFAKRGSKNSGRPKTLRKCPDCGKEFGAREMRSHDCKPSK